MLVGFVNLVKFFVGEWWIDGVLHDVVTTVCALDHSHNTNAAIVSPKRFE
jgi:hypothetical protein